MSDPEIRYPSRIFDHPNMHGGFQCPVCLSGADAPVVLVGIPGTEQDGIMEARQVHAECWKVVDLMRQIEEAQKAKGSYNEETH